MRKISLIIPVYNVEQYIGKCINSCVKQDILLDEYEIIIINDGTKDNSLNIAKQFADEFENIKIYSQVNQGLSAARNKGLSLANGEYIWFIDSDDFIETNCLGEIVNKCISNNLDALAICGANIIGGESVRRNEFLSNEVVRGTDVMLNPGFQVGVPFTIYRRKFLVENSLQFFHGIFYEDSEFTPRSYYFAEKVLLCNDVLYYVIQNPVSITRTINSKKSFDIIIVCNSLSEFSKLVHSKYVSIYDFFISMYLNCSLNYSLEMGKHDKEILNDYIYENRILYKHLVRSNKIKYKIEGVLFKLFPRKSIQIYQFLCIFSSKHIDMI